MRAAAAIEVSGSRCSVLQSDPPLTFRQTSAGVQWVGSAAGPLGGDDLALDVALGAGATLVLSSVAAALVHPGPHGEVSRLAVSVRVGAAATLRWAPRPTVLVRGCDHEIDTVLDIEAGATVVWREEVVLGRHEEATGSLRQRFVADVEGRPLVRTELSIGPRYPGSLGPAGTDGARAVGSVLVVGPAAADALAAPRVADGAVRLAAQAVARQATLVTAVAGRAAALTRALDAYTAAGA